MAKLLDIITKLHLSTNRDYLARMNEQKVSCMTVANDFGYDFWDGKRCHGYGGYSYDGRWKTVAEDLIKEFNLKDGCKILDVGCGKAYLLFELKLLLPNAEVVGFDISDYALNDAKEEVTAFLFKHKAQETYPFNDKVFDLVLSINTLHNLKIFELKKALSEIERVGRKGYVLVEGYRNEEELFNLECWALTCESFFRPEEWIWLYKEFGYSGDYEFIYFN